MKHYWLSLLNSAIAPAACQFDKRGRGGPSFNVRPHSIRNPLYSSKRHSLIPRYYRQGRGIGVSNL